MQLQSISFERTNYNDQSSWKYTDLEFGNINLIVGQNASGKSRIVRTIFALSELMIYNKIKTSDKVKLHWTAKLLSDNNEIYTYEVIYQDNMILLELLILNKEVLIERNNKGIGKIKSMQLNNYLDFEVDLDVLILFNKRDKLHHPFIINITEWAENLSYFSFGAPLGQNTHAIIPNSKPNLSNKRKKIKLHSKDNALIKNDVHVVIKFHIGVDQIGEKFKDDIIADINSLGYNITDITLKNVPNTELNDQPLMCLHIQEDEKTFVSQSFISQGMFRALSIIIQITFNKYLATPTSLLVDDIGEGLDFERSTKLIKLLINRVEENPDKQIFLTTNDKYVMNSVPLKYWNIIYRHDSEIKCKNIRNSQQIFEDFSFTGLNNFDFFSGKIFNNTSMTDNNE